MSDKIELLPFPFCGGKAHWPEPEVNIHYVGCMSCAACATGVEDWNRRAAIDQQPAPAVPAGWKLVPAKPTTDMCNAAAEATGYDDYHGAYVGYIAMLAAAPAAPVAQEPVAWPDEIHQMAFEEGQPAENGDGYSFTAEEFDLFVERLLSRAAPPAAEQPDTVAVPRKVLRELTDTAITEWHDPSVNEAAQDRNECLCCGVEDGHNADCAVAIALRLLAGGAE